MQKQIITWFLAMIATTLFILSIAGCGTGSSGSSDTNSTTLTTWAGTKLFGTTANDYGSSVTVDSNGNIYVAGAIYDGLGGITDAFVAKFDSAGVMKWAQTIETPEEEHAEGIAIDQSGNIYVTGFTSGSLEGHTNVGGDDIFLIKYDADGTKQWSRQFGTADSDRAEGMAIDGYGSVYITGATGGNLDGNINQGSWDVFITKYDPSGGRQWTKQVGTTGYDSGYGVAADGSGNEYIIGSTDGGLDGNISSGTSDLFLIKYDSVGAKLWTKQLGTAGFEYAFGIAGDVSGNVYVVGYTTGNLDGNINAGNSDIFVVKYDSSGTKQWTKQLGTTGFDNAYGVASDGSGNIFVTGHTDGNLDGNIVAGNADIFLVKFNSSGAKQWTKEFGTASEDVAYSVATDTSGNAYITGFTGDNLDGSTNFGGQDVFLIKYDSNGVKQ